MVGLMVGLMVDPMQGLTERAPSPGVSTARRGDQGEIR